MKIEEKVLYIATQIQLSLCLTCFVKVCSSFVDLLCNSMIQRNFESFLEKYELENEILDDTRKYSDIKTYYSSTKYITKFVNKLL